MKHYDELEKYSFKFEDNNTILVSDILIDEFGCKIGNEYQVLKDDIVVYPDNILCNPSKDSVSIHVFTGTWLDEKKPLTRKINKFLKLNINTKKKAERFAKYITNRGK